MKIFCLQIVKAFPDYKRPRSSTNIYHFTDEFSANEKRRQEKAKYYQDFIDYLKQDEDTIIKDIDDLDEDEAQTDWVYKDSYMDMEPFSATLYEIEIIDECIKTKRINFPNDIDISDKPYEPCESYETYFSNT
jgi:hypothetical protein